MTTSRQYLKFISLKSVSKQDGISICKNFSCFIIEVLKGLKFYLPFSDLVLNNISTLDPVASSTKKWIELVNRFPNIISETNLPDFHVELATWSQDKDLKERRNEFLIKRTDENNMEVKVFDIVTFYRLDNLYRKYPLIFKLSRAILALPHSNAPIERAFSQLKIIKDDKRNSLSNETLQALLISKINKLDLQSEEIQARMLEYFLEWHPIMTKRKSMEVAEKKDNIITKNEENGNETKNQDMEIEESITDVLLKKLKLNSTTKEDCIDEDKKISIPSLKVEEEKKSN